MTIFQADADGNETAASPRGMANHNYLVACQDSFQESAIKNETE
jgi:hypothetical protein